jgi:hypothetical protein
VSWAPTAADSLKCRTVRAIRLYSDAVTRSAPTTVDIGDAKREDATPRGGAPSAVAHGRRWVVGVASAAATYFVLAAGVLPAWVTLTVGAALVVTMPTARSCARRIALNAAILVGWSQVLWWVEWPFPLNHGALLTALAAGFLTARVVTATDRGTALRGLLPQLHLVDALIPVSVLVGTAALWRWVTASSPQRALEALLPGADNYAHFHMFSTLRAYGATTTALGSAPDGSGWGFDEYPQGFHALVATVSELVRPGLVPGPDALVAYVHGVALAVVLGLAMVTAAAVSLPGVRSRPDLAVPAVVLTWTAFLWEPGQNLIADGFANFELAAAAAASALLLAVNRGRRPRTVELAAIGGLLMFVAHAWAPLVVIAAPAALAVLYPFRTPLRQTRSRAEQLAPVLVVLACVLGMAKAFVTLVTQVDVSNVVTAFGGLHGSSPLPTFALMAVAIYVCARYPRWVDASRRDDLDAARRVRLLTLSPLLGVVSLALLFAAQMLTVGTTAYYFLKYLMGFELILTAFVPALVVMALSRVVGRFRRRSWTVAATIVATVLATQAYGRFPHGHPALLVDHHKGTAAMAGPYSADRVARGVLAAVRGSSHEQAFGREYVAIGADRAAEAFYPDGWYHGILPSLTRDVQDRVDVLRHHVDTPRAAVPLVRRLLVSHPDLEVIVDPRYAPSLRDSLARDDLARRVITWPSARTRVG